MKVRKVSVVGLGKLGSSIAVAVASRGFEVVGIDISRDIVSSINEGKAPFKEPGLQELLERHPIKATTDYEAVRGTDLTLVVVPTPSNPDGSFSSKYLEDVFVKLAPVLRGKDDFHIVSVVSTVSPGTSAKLIEMMEGMTGKKCGSDWGYCYNPTFIALGSVIKNFLEPDLVLIGASDKVSGQALKDFYSRVVLNDPYIALMSIPSAEITKIALNSFVTMKISFANTLAEICERVEGANIDDITRALGADRRVSPYYLKGGLAYGGPCFPRDNRAFSHFARSVGVEPYLAEATDKVNQHQVERIVERVFEFIARENGRFEGKVSLFGLSYKPGTPVIDESPAIKIAEGLFERGIEVCVWDPLAMENAFRVLGEKVRWAKSFRDALEFSKFWIFATAHKEFRELERMPIPSDAVIFDPWRIFWNSPVRQKVSRYFAVGVKTA